MMVFHVIFTSLCFLSVFSSSLFSLSEKREREGPTPTHIGLVLSLGVKRAWIKGVSILYSGSLSLTSDLSWSNIIIFLVFGYKYTLMAYYVLLSRTEGSKLA